MGQPDRQSILDEIVQTQSLLTELACLMQEKVLATQEIIAQSRELLARTEKQFQQKFPSDVAASDGGKQ
jgi:hypothetical protein